MKLNWKEDWPLYLIMLVTLSVFGKISVDALSRPGTPLAAEPAPQYWVAPNLNLDHEPVGEAREQLVYGYELISHTARYFGPSGSVLQTTNGMNCQNCHLDAGTKPWGNNYGGVFSTYPKFRDRSGMVETISKRVNDCFERSLNGKALDTNSKEMLAMVAYIQWLGQNVKKGEKPVGSGIRELPYPDRAADPAKGQQVYTAKCQSCHGENGEGVPAENKTEFTYPPLWGEHSYNNGAGLYRLSRFAGYVKDNMPFNQPASALTSAEAWDVAAFVNSRPRPVKDLGNDWPDISKKPVDHPFGPYADGFSEQQHKFGPFQPIVDARKKIKAEQAGK